MVQQDTLMFPFGDLTGLYLFLGEPLEQINRCKCPLLEINTVTDLLLKARDTLGLFKLLRNITHGPLQHVELILPCPYHLFSCF